MKHGVLIFVLCSLALSQGIGGKAGAGGKAGFGGGQAAAANVAFDAAASGTSIASGTTQSWNHTVTGSNPALVVCLDTDTAPSGVTFNGVSMTQWFSHKDGASVAFAVGYVLAGPATGTHSIAVTYSGSVGIANGKSMSFTNVNQATPTRTAVSSDDGGGGSGTISTTAGSATSGDAVVGCAEVFGGTLASMTPNQTAPTTTPANPEIKMQGGSFSMGMQYIAPASGSTALTWTLNTSEFWSQGVVPIAHQ